MDATARLRSLLAAPSTDAAEIADQLDRLPSHEAVAAARSLGGRRIQRSLWHCSAANDPITVTDLLPAEYEPMKPVRFHGKNSLPAFTVFEKICCRPPKDRPGAVLWGYNETRIRPLIGPGYFVVHDTKGNSFGGAAFDYTAVPEDHPGGWPDIRPNEQGLSRFIYNGTIDYMRRVARDVFIGAATRAGNEMDSYFVLVREPI
ncbi:MAG: hypothetical protein V3R77_08475 [Candidatus Binatia bacterium]